MDESRGPNDRGMRIVALVATLALPGLGHVMQGRASRAVFWLCAFVLMWGGCLALAAVWLGGLALGLGLSLAWLVACAIDAYRQSRAPRRAGPLAAYIAAACSILIAFPIVLPIATRMLVIEAFKVSSQGMCPSFQSQDRVFVDKSAYRGPPPQRGDVVLYLGRGPNRKASFIHRVVAVSGDDVEVLGGKVVVNGSALALRDTGEDKCTGARVFEENQGGIHRIAIDPAGPVANYRMKVPRGHVYVLGDNRTSSYDSREAGAIPIPSIQGKVWRIWMQEGRLVWRPAQ